MKKGIIALGVIVVVAVAWYLISPLFIVEEANEPSPLEQSSNEEKETTKTKEPVVDDALVSMNTETRVEFDAAVEEKKDVVVEMQEPMPQAQSEPSSEPSLVAEGEFVARAHEVEGKALLIESGDKKVLRFEDFETINGPNLHIYLSSDLSENDFVDLGPIKATKGNVNYELDASIDTDKYNKVLVWCVPFRVLFSYAELK